MKNGLSHITGPAIIACFLGIGVPSNTVNSHATTQLAEGHISEEELIYTLPTGAGKDFTIHTVGVSPSDTPTIEYDERYILPICRLDYWKNTIRSAGVLLTASQMEQNYKALIQNISAYKLATTPSPLSETTLRTKNDIADRIAEILHSFATVKQSEKNQASVNEFLYRNFLWKEGVHNFRHTYDNIVCSYPGT